MYFCTEKDSKPRFAKNMSGYTPKLEDIPNYMKKILTVLATLILGVTIMQAHEIKKVENKVENGYNFWLATPEGGEDDPVGKPLVVFLHGSSLSGTNMEKLKKYGSLSALLRGRNIDAYVVAPQSPGGGWKPDKVWNVIDYVLDECNVDTTRVYVLGMSLGGYGTLDVAATYPDRIAAAIAMCGGATVKDLTGLAEMPLWIIHGTGDSAVSVSKSDQVVDVIRKTQKKKGIADRLTYDRIPGMNHSQPARLFNHIDIYDWLFQHSLDDKGRPTAEPSELTKEFWDSCYK